MTIVFDIFPSYGHQNASYKLAKLLKDCGHSVYYVGQYRYFLNLPPEFKRRYINPHIFSFIEIRTKNKWTNMKIAYKETREHKIYAFNQKVRNQYDELMEKIKPDVILVDYHYVQKAILYHQYRVPVISVQTTLATEMNRFVPPFCSAHIPDQSLFSRFIILYLWYSYILKKRIRLFLYKILFLGEDHLSDVMRLSQQTGFPLKKFVDYKQYKGYGEFGLKNIPQLLLSPRDFDFPRPLMGNQYAIGPLLLKENSIKIKDRRYQAVIDRILQEKKEGKISFVYCSLGTLNDFGLQNSIKTFQYVVEVGRRNPNYRIVISSGEYVNPARLLPIPDNVFLFKYVLQNHILRYCDMMIAHGGQNSITECIMNEVPLLIYPFFKGSDLGGNSARVLYHGIGNRGFIKKETVNRMEEKIQDVLHNPVYRSNIHAMRLKFEVKNNSTEAIEIIENIVKAYKNGN